MFDKTWVRFVEDYLGQGMRIKVRAELGSYLQKQPNGDHRLVYKAVIKDRGGSIEISPLIQPRSKVNESIPNRAWVN